jgi:hypothetical protein
MRIVRGAFRDHIGLYAGMSGPERVAVLLSLFGGTRGATLLKDAVEPAG